MSNLKLKAYPANYAEALEFLGGRVDKKLGHNTALVNYGNGSAIHVLYHGNIIATYYRDAGQVKNSIEVPVVAFRTAGWDTVTTTRRLSMLMRSVIDRLGKYGASVGITNGSAQLRTWNGDYMAEQTIGDSAVCIFGDGYITLKVDVEGMKLAHNASEYVSPY